MIGARNFFSKLWRSPRNFIGGSPNEYRCACVFFLDPKNLGPSWTIDWSTCFLTCTCTLLVCLIGTNSKDIFRGMVRYEDASYPSKDILSSWWWRANVLGPGWFSMQRYYGIIKSFNKALNYHLNKSFGGNIHSKPLNHWKKTDFPGQHSIQASSHARSKATWRCSDLRRKP